MPDIRLKIHGDSADAVRATNTLQHELRQVRQAANEGAAAASAKARTAVAAAAREVSAQKSLVRELEAVARQARRGSEEQRIASGLAQRAAQALARSYGEVGREATRAGALARAAMASAERSSNSARRSLVSTAASGAGSALRTGGIIGGTVAAGAAGVTGALGLSFYTQMESSQIAFTQLLGSGKAAKEMLVDLAKFAAATPFEFPGLVLASQRLLNVGFQGKQVIPVMTAVGNAVAAAGGSAEVLDHTVRALGQVQSKGRLMAEEMMQFNEAGTFSWRALAAEIGTSVPEAMKLVQNGAVTSEIFLKAFTDSTSKRFGDMMEKQSHTMKGLFSTLKDTLSMTAATILTPTFKAITVGMQSIATYTGRPEFLAGVRKWSEIVNREMRGAIVGLWNWLKTNWPEIKAVFAAAWTTFSTGVVIAKQVVTALNVVADKVGGWKVLLAAMAAGWVAAKIAMITFMTITRVQAILTSNTIKAALISTGFGAVVVALGIAVTLIIAHWGQIRSFVAKLARAIPDLLQAAWDVVVAAANKAASLIIRYFTLGIRTLLEIASHLPFVGDKAKEALDKIEGFIDGFEERGAKRMESAGKHWGDAFAANLRATAQKAIESLATGAVSRPEEGSRGTGASGVKLTGDLDSNANVQSFARKVGAIAGSSSLAISSGKRTQAENKGAKRSDHLTGKAIDIAATGAYLIKLGQSALIAAGMSPGDAAKHTSYYGEFNGYFIAFNTREGGYDHTNHLHISVRNPGSVTLPTPAPAPPAVTGVGGVDLSGSTGAKPQKPSLASVAVINVVRDSLEQEIGQAEKAGDSRIARALRKIRAELREGIKTEDLAAIKLKMKQYGRTIDGELKAASDAAKKHAAQIKAAAKAAASRAAEVVAARASDFKEAWQRFAQGAMQAFDRVTQKELAKWQKRVADHVSGMRATFKQQMVAFDAETRRGLAGLAAPGETAEERALREFDEARSAGQSASDASARASNLAEAIAGGDAAQIAAAQREISDAALEEQRRGLERAADLSRVEADRNAERAQTAYQQQRDLLAESLEAAQNLREEAYSLEQDAAMQEYQDQRQIQRDNLDLQLSDLVEHLISREATWASANAALAGVMAAGGSDVGNAFVNGLKAAFAAAGVDYGELGQAQAQQQAIIETAAARALRLRSEALNKAYGLGAYSKHSTGGWTVPGADLGRDSVPTMLRPGEYVMSGEERRRQGSGGGGTQLVFAPVFHGSVYDKDEVTDMIRRELLSFGRRLGVATVAPSVTGSQIFGGRG